MSDALSKKLAQLKQAFESGLLDEETYNSAIAALEATIAENSGAGAVAQVGGVASGTGGVAVRGNVEGNIIILNVKEYWERKGVITSPDLEKKTQAYLHYLVDKYQYLDIRGMGVPRVSLKLSITEPYVPLKARIEMPKGDTWARHLRVAGRKVTEEEAEVMGERISEPLPIIDLLHKHDGLIILGDLGAGKTTFLKYLAVMLAQGRGQAIGLEERLPILLPLSAYANALADSDIPLDAFIADYYHDMGVSLPIDAMLQKALKQGGALLLLDGLDEVREQGLRRIVVDRVVDFFAVQRRQGNKFILTSRIVGYREVRPTVEGLQECTLVDFDDEDIELFITQWTAALEKAAHGGQTPVAMQEAKREKEKLLAAVRCNKGVRQLASNPLLLTILALMKRQDVTLPERRVELYQTYVETLLKQWNLDRGLGRPPSRDLDVVETLRVLAPLALWMHETSPGVGLVKQEALQHKLVQICTARKFSYPVRAARQFLEDVREYAGLLLEQRPRQYGFIHLTFQEYLAGVAIAEQGQQSVDAIVRLLGQHMKEETWHEVTLLSIGYLGLIQQQDEVAGQVLMQLIENAPDSPGVAVVRAGEAAVDVWPGGITYQARDGVIEACLHAMRNDGRIPAVLRAQAGDNLAQLGDPRFRADVWYLPDDPMLGFVEIPAGPFKIGSAQITDFEKPLHELYLPTFFISRFPVTEQQFKAFVTTTDFSRGYSNILENPLTSPIRYVNWYEALAYCRWLTSTLKNWSGTPSQIAQLLNDGWRFILPSEAEWEKAARGKDARQYPWGDNFDADRSNHPFNEINDTSVVGCFPKGRSPYGLEEMMGNVWEWTRSIDKEYPYDPLDGRENLNVRGFRILRGGSFSYQDVDIKISYRYRHLPKYRRSNFGFRIALIPPY